MVGPAGRILKGGTPIENLIELLRSALELYVERWDWFLNLLLVHMGLAASAIGIAGTLGLLLGVRYAGAVMGVTNVFYTVPAISLLGILIPFLGIGNKTAVAALTVYALMPMVRNTYAGLTAIDSDIVEAARGMGSTRAQILFRVKLPLALGVILAGLRNMVVMSISVCSVASFIGAGGLGVAIYRGITTYKPAMTFAGSLLIALLALTCDFLLGRVERHYKKKWRLTI